MSSTKTFYYFAFGSNLLKERIQLNNATAKFISSGLLKNYKLSFYKQLDDKKLSHFGWCGGTASITPSEIDEVHGSVWELHKENLSSLDEQEGVPTVYYPIEVDIQLPGQLIKCRSYRMHCTNEAEPSPFYLDIILRGACQCKLLEDYINKLRSIKHNNYFGSCELYWKVLKSSNNINIEDFQVEELRALDRP